MLKPNAKKYMHFHKWRGEKVIVEVNEWIAVETAKAEQHFLCLHKLFVRNGINVGRQEHLYNGSRYTNPLSWKVHELLSYPENYS